MADFQIKNMLTQEEIERRKPLWQALSDLWLADYEFDRTATNELKKEVLSGSHSQAELASVFSTYENSDTQTVREMISSGYSLSEIENILSEEVAPVVYFNGYKPYGGEWGGFDSDWLFPEIIKNLKKQESNLIYRTWVRSAVGKFVMTKMVQNDWKKIVELYKSSIV